ncbi:MAG TPA: SUF system NifU family Fe-S cluster assembly protein [Terriglobia bacterium]|nr:SUF system NifU family Fe-S cluster assembly protein [Terriglobia bacterium]
MSDLRDLYQEVILDHAKHPRNCRRQQAPSCLAQGNNPLCGDKVRIYLELDGSVIKDISFEGTGCAISTASASLMTESLKGRTLEEAYRLFEEFHHLVTSPAEAIAQFPELGKLEVFAGVREFPVRVKCATLAWHTLKAALENKPAVSTE